MLIKLPDQSTEQIDQLYHVVEQDLPHIEAIANGQLVNTHKVFKYPAHQLDAGCIIHVKWCEIPTLRNWVISTIAENMGIQNDDVAIQDDCVRVCILKQSEQIYSHIDTFNDYTMSCMIVLSDFVNQGFRLGNTTLQMHRGDVIIFNRAIEHQIFPITEGTAMIAFTGIKLNQ